MVERFFMDRCQWSFGVMFSNCLIIYGMINNILGAVVYLSTAIVFGGSTALLMLFIKENSDRCHYYNGKWNKIDLLCGAVAICAGMVVNHYLLRL